MSAAEFIVVLTNMPDQTAAMRLAEALVERRLAACVNVIEGCTSLFRWQGRIESERELPVLIKTRASLYPALETAIRELHPYELPEIVALPVLAGSPAYLSWVAAQTGA